MLCNSTRQCTLYNVHFQIFEKDPIKYKQYEEAVYQILLDRGTFVCFLIWYNYITVLEPVSSRIPAPTGNITKSSAHLKILEFY